MGSAMADLEQQHDPGAHPSPLAKSRRMLTRVALLAGGGTLVLYLLYVTLNQQPKPLLAPLNSMSRRALESETRADWNDALERALKKMNPAQRQEWLAVSNNLVQLQKTRSTLAYWAMASNTVVLLNWLQTGRFEELKL
jgi:hypothetical protein